MEIVLELILKPRSRDAQGQRDLAVQQYKRVLRKPRRWASQDNADERLDHPFQQAQHHIAFALRGIGSWRVGMADVVRIVDAPSLTRRGYEVVK